MNQTGTIPLPNRLKSSKPLLLQASKVLLVTVVTTWLFVWGAMILDEHAEAWFSPTVVRHYSKLAHILFIPMVVLVAEVTAFFAGAFFVKE